MAGINRALTESRALARSNEAAGKLCIFLSHISVDKPSAVAVGNYITARGDIDIYLDTEDAHLQLAVLIGDAAGITSFIERRIFNCTHVMCLVSASTIDFLDGDTRNDAATRRPRGKMLTRS